MGKYLYVAVCDEHSKTKIGITNSIKARMRQLSYEEGADVRCVYQSVGLDNALECEKQALACCVNNIHGEWFNCTKEHAIRCVEDAVSLKGVKGVAVKGTGNSIWTFCATTEQREWVENECSKTGESQATVMRKLIQQEINNENK